MMRNTRRGKTGGRAGRRLREIAQVLAITVALALMVKLLIVDAIHVPSPSMERTLHAGDFVLVNKLMYGPSTPPFIPLTRIRLPHFRFPPLVSPRPGDVMVFRFPREDPQSGRDTNLTYVKRLIGLPGERVEIRDGSIFVDGTRPPGFPEGVNGQVADFGPVVVPPEHYFVLGDNLADSYDSRAWGCVPADAVIGKAFLVYWSVGDRGVRWERIGMIVR